MEFDLFQLLVEKGMIKTAFSIIKKVISTKNRLDFNISGIVMYFFKLESKAIFI